MREIKIGNILMYRRAKVCVIFRIIEGEDGLPDTIVGMDHNNTLCEGPAEEWSSIIHKKDCLRIFEDGIFNNIVVGRRV